MSGLNIKELLKPGFHQEIAKILANGKEANRLSFDVLALRKDGSEFATQFSFRLLQDFNFRWAVFVQDPAGSNGGADRSVREPQAIVPTTETTTTETPEPEILEASQNERNRLERIKSELDERLRQDQLNYENGLNRLEQDLSAEPEMNGHLSKEPEAQEQSISAQIKGRRKSQGQQSGPAAASENTQDDIEDLKRRHQTLKSEAAGLRKERDESRSKLPGSQELKIDDQDSTRQRLEAENRNLTETKAELDKERETIRVSRRKEEVLQTQVQTLQGVLEQAEARAHESAPQSKDWEKRAAVLKKSVDELTRRHAAEQSAAIKAAQRVKELEDQLKRGGDDQAAGKKDIEDQDAMRRLLEAENHNLSQANAKARAELEKEREANKLFRKKEEELEAQVQKLQGALEQVEARPGDSAAPRSRDWEKKVADLKKSVDELTRRHAVEQSAALNATQRIKELEEQLERAADEPAGDKKNIEDQDTTRQILEAENHSLRQSNAKVRVELDKERDAIKISRKKEEELETQVQKLQDALEQAEARADESTEKARNWEKKAADLKKPVDELTRSHAAEQSTASKRVKELEQQLKRAAEDLAASKAENGNLTESAERQAALENKIDELEQRAHKAVFSLAKVNAELESACAEREQAEKNASAAIAQMEKLKEKLKQQVELERTSQSKIAELEKIIQDRGDDLARASAALRREAKERQIAQKQSRLVSEMGDRLESNLASLEDAKKAFELSLNEKDERLQKKDERLQIVERSLAEANSGLEKESAERRRLDGLLADARQQLEKLSVESKAKLSKLQAALDLGELQRKRLEVDLLRSRDVVENAEQDPGTAPDNRANPSKKKSASK